jgi:hypothetical protein
MFAQPAGYSGGDDKVAGRMATLSEDGRRERNAERRYDMTERPTVVTAEQNHQIRIEPLDALRGRGQRRAELAAEGAFDIAFLTRAVTRADHQSL